MQAERLEKDKIIEPNINEIDMNVEPDDEFSDTEDSEVNTTAQMYEDRLEAQKEFEEKVQEHFNKAVRSDDTKAYTYYSILRGKLRTARRTLMNCNTEDDYKSYDKYFASLLKSYNKRREKETRGNVLLPYIVITSVLFTVLLCMLVASTWIGIKDETASTAAVVVGHTEKSESPTLDALDSVAENVVVTVMNEESE